MFFTRLSFELWLSYLTFFFLFFFIRMHNEPSLTGKYQMGIMVILNFLETSPSVFVKVVHCVHYYVQLKLHTFSTFVDATTRYIGNSDGKKLWVNA